MTLQKTREYAGKMPALLWLILILGVGTAYASDDALKLADWMLKSGSYDEAITEYKRFIFFNPESDHIGYAQYRMGLAYRAVHNWQKSVDAFKASISVAGDSKTADERRIILATTLIASGNYSLARLELLKVLNQPLRSKSLYFDGIASLYMFDWDASKEAFSRFYSEYADTKRAREIDSILLKTRQSYRSAELAKSLSTILPGLGQVYAGNWQDGLNALVLNGVFAGFIANAIHRRDYKDATLISYISLRYYIGNRRRAEIDVREYNESLNRRSALKILKLVRSDEPT